MALQRCLVALAILNLIGCTPTLSAADSQIQIIDFTAKSCAPCQSMQPVIVKLAKEGWHIRQVDVEQERQLIEPFQVKSVPTLVILRDGKEVDRVIGALGYDKLKARFQKATGKSTTDTLKDDFLAMVAPGNNGQAGLSGNRSGNSASSSASAAGTVRGQSPSAFPLLSAASGAIGGAVSGAAALGSLEANAPAVQPAFEPAVQPAGQPAVQPAAYSMQPLSDAPAMAAGGAAAVGFDAHAADFNRLATQPNAQPNTQFASLAAPRPQSAIGQNAQVAQNALSGQAAVARAQAATVRIRVDEPNAISYGTGTVINMHGNQALVLTCGHIFRDMTNQARLSVDVYQQGQAINVPAQLVSFNAKEADIGLIEFRAPFAIEPVPVAPMAAAPQIGQPAFSFGCDKGADPSRRDTQIKRVNRYLGAANVEIHGAPVVGRSGGGLFDAEGRLVGICNAADEEDDEGIYAALPVIHQQLSALQLDNLAQATSPAPQIAANDNATQVQCIIHDAQGRQSTLVIDRPSESLLAMLRQSARQ